jgi:hypothetical protein
MAMTTHLRLTPAVVVVPAIKRGAPRLRSIPFAA